MGTPVTLTNVIIQYLQIFTPKIVTAKGVTAKPDDEPKYTARFILPPNFDWQYIQAAVQAAKAETFGANFQGALKKTYHKCEDARFAGQFYLNATSDTEHQPDVIDNQNQPILDQKALFGGCIVSAVVDFWGYKTGSNGIGCGLKIVRLEDNENVVRLDEKLNPEDFFKPVQGAPANTAQNTAMVQQQQGQQQQVAGNGVASGPPADAQNQADDEPWNS